MSKMDFLQYHEPTEDNIVLINDVILDCADHIRVSHEFAMGMMRLAVENGNADQYDADLIDRVVNNIVQKLEDYAARLREHTPELFDRITAERQ